MQNPESWASSEINENIAQFARFIFLRDLWKMVTPKGSREWLRDIELPNDDGQGGVKQHIKESSAKIDDLTELVRAQATRVNVAYLLDGYAPGGGHVEEVQWAIFELDDEGESARAIDGLHESVDDVGSESGN